MTKSTRRKMENCRHLDIQIVEYPQDMKRNGIGGESICNFCGKRWEISEAVIFAQQKASRIKHGEHESTIEPRQIEKIDRE